ncbi:hypothetical protein LY76DRAFT_124562 [Colletotrichum caudatum]|nr:hypothetical protein LY76DRAFT_124562 [Colletotrichum caudatum]
MYAQYLFESSATSAQRLDSPGLAPTRLDSTRLESNQLDSTQLASRPRSPSLLCLLVAYKTDTRRNDPRSCSLSPSPVRCPSSPSVTPHSHSYSPSLSLSLSHSSSSSPVDILQGDESTNLSASSSASRTKCTILIEPPSKPSLAKQNQHMPSLPS